MENMSHNARKAWILEALILNFTEILTCKEFIQKTLLLDLNPPDKSFLLRSLSILHLRVVYNSNPADNLNNENK